METDLINRPTFVVAMTERELRDALDDPAKLQSALRRQLLQSKGIEPLQLQAPAAPARQKVGGGKVRTSAKRKAKPASDKREYSCGQCDHEPFTSAGFLARHERQAHGGESERE